MKRMYFPMVWIVLHTDDEVWLKTELHASRKYKVCAIYLASLVQSILKRANEVNYLEVHFVLESFLSDRKWSHDHEPILPGTANLKFVYNERI